MIKQVIISNGNEQLIYIPQFFPEDLFSELSNQIEWKQNTIRVFGIEHLEPRQTAWFGKPYKYSNISWPEKEYNDLLIRIQHKIIQCTDYKFNSVLANYYRSGQDSMGWHSDNEAEMDTALIASASFGGSRVFKLRNRMTNKKHDVELNNNSLLLMYNLQHNWQHSISKTKRVVEPRINLTFRRIISRNTFAEE